MLVGLGTDRPKRLIDLTPFNDDVGNVRLVDGLAIKSSYATLSYCWGTATEMFTTTLSTLSSRMSCINSRDAPKTFQNAFEITRALGIRYIWIDALCILQDSASDWKEESSKMGAIYSNSFVTIAIDWSSDPNSGCYRETSHNFHEDADNHLFKAIKTSKDGITTLLYLEEDYMPELADLETAILATRGWTFQERILSPRIIHYTQKQLYWECRRAIFAEDSIPRNYEQKFPAPRITDDMKAMAGRQETSRLVDLWYHFVISQSYAKRVLTFPSDKLPAVSALARLFSQHIKVPYLAGLWDYELIWGLAWRVVPETYPTGHRLDNGCPSWSWTSIKSDIRWDTMSWAFDGKPNYTFIDIKEATVQLEGKDPFGRVTGGCIRLVGRVVKCRPDGRTISEYYMNPHGLRDVTGGLLSTEDGNVLGKPYLDISDDSIQPTHCLLHSAGCAQSEDLGLGILLAQTAEDPTKFRRLGICVICAPSRMRSIEDIFKGCPELTLDLV
jgi:hypothetical protein